MNSSLPLPGATEICASTLKGVTGQSFPAAMTNSFRGLNLRKRKRQLLPLGGRSTEELENKYQRESSMPSLSRVYVGKKFAEKKNILKNHFFAPGFSKFEVA